MSFRMFVVLVFLVVGPWLAHANPSGSSNVGNYDPGLSTGWYDPADSELGPWQLEFFVDGWRRVLVDPDNYIPEDNSDPNIQNIFSEFNALTVNQKREFLQHRAEYMNKFLRRMLRTEFIVEDYSLFFGKQRVFSWRNSGSTPPDEVLTEIKVAHLKKFIETTDIDLFRGAATVASENQFGLQVGGVVGLNWIRTGIERAAARMFEVDDPDRNLEGLFFGTKLRTIYDKSTRRLHLDFSLQLYRGRQAIFFPSLFEAAIYPYVGVTSGYNQFDYIAPASEPGPRTLSTVDLTRRLTRIFGEGAADWIDSNIAAPIRSRVSGHVYIGAGSGGMSDVLISSLYFGEFASRHRAHSIIPWIPLTSFPWVITGLNTYRSRRILSTGFTFYVQAPRPVADLLDWVLESRPLARCMSLLRGRRRGS